ncbi:MAG: hypothetical protein LQ338_003575 [Usnochroma carphineum]|nr:MAG: hypothetical protein LQ338_003575 [Usnochroma carphineum]
MDVLNIDAKGDLVVAVTQTSKDATHRTAHFRVSKDILKNVSQVLLTMLVDPHWTKGSQSLVSLGEGHIAVTEVWLRIMHNTILVYNLLFPEIWHLVQAIDYYELDVTAFNDWFAAWYQKNNTSMFKPAELLFPTWRFNHAKGFARWTHDLAYQHTGHITEKNPTALYQYHLPARLIQQLNAAKGRLRTVLFRGLWGPCHELLDADCACKKGTLFDYQKHLYTIDVWPLETIFLRNSIDDILQNLTKFSYEASASACGKCRQDYKGIVARVASSVRGYFNGLCLDCLDHSKPKTGDIDQDYWCHDKLKEYEWVHGCRFPHKQPTWYFSFNGRKEERDRLVKQRELERRNTNRPTRPGHHRGYNRYDNVFDEGDGAHWGTDGSPIHNIQDRHGGVG